MPAFVYDKKIIVTFDSYEQLAEHMDFHEMYYEWLCDLVDTYNLAGPHDVPLAISWWYDQSQIDCNDGDFPSWSSDLEGKAIRAESLIPSTIVESFVNKINEVSTKYGQAPSNIEIIDAPA